MKVSHVMIISMVVCLIVSQVNNVAAQTFSSSVAKALQFMKDDIKDSPFQGRSHDGIYPNNK
jgi:hypothetical protein